MPLYDTSLVEVRGLEPPTNCLQSSRSPVELHPHGTPCRIRTHPHSLEHCYAIQGEGSLVPSAGLEPVIFVVRGHALFQLSFEGNGAGLGIRTPSAIKHLFYRQARLSNVGAPALVVPLGFEPRIFCF